MTRKPALIALLLVCAARLFGDGGAVILHQQSGPFAITVFASPVPARAGIIDLSVLVQTIDSLQPVLDATVAIEFTKNVKAIKAAATHSQAQNKLLYAASIPMPDAGDWRYRITIRKADQSGEVADTIQLAPEPARLTSYRGLLALPFVCLVVLALHQWLSGRRRIAIR